MTDRIHALTVFLAEPMRDDDVQEVMSAIKMIKHVASVKAHVSSIDTEWAEDQARRELREKLWNVLE